MMSSRFIALAVVTVGFSVLTALALLDVGYLGILQPHFETWGGAQVLVDLVIVAALACLWMISDARKRGLPAWPFIGLTLVGGSFGPLLYLLVREMRAGQAERASA